MEFKIDRKALNLILTTLLISIPMVSYADIWGPGGAFETFFYILGLFILTTLVTIIVLIKKRKSSIHPVFSSVGIVYFTFIAIALYTMHDTPFLSQMPSYLAIPMLISVCLSALLLWDLIYRVKKTEKKFYSLGLIVLGVVLLKSLLDLIHF